MSEIDDLVSKIMSQMGQSSSEKSGTATTIPTSDDNHSALTAKDYPLYSKHPELVHSPSGKSLDEITIDNLLSEKVKLNDLRITTDTLRLQGEVAADAGRSAVQRNLQRAAELTKIPDDRVLEMYNALRPYRSTKQELFDIATELRDKYNATICAGWFEEAAANYEARKKLKGDN
ncbi:propanediol dehydratase [Pediococcus claussenii]|uniref:diol dehydratase small subunit n=1 Tax=Pediococcus claussenii TaxID=187452 RepID=UPI00081A7CC3|nr:diol dehydratase small subunit [Pediococcus claussenii]ANZ69126.1 propanediol dehydratase [Pediococcus claussenii]